jgi:hypothetical protein
MVRTMPYESELRDRSVIAGPEARDAHRLTIGANDVSSKSITVHVACSEYLRLHRHYEAALRRWEQVEWASNKNRPLDTSATRLAAEVKRKAQNERDAAKMLINLHKRRCSICSHMRTPRTPGRVA